MNIKTTQLAKSVGDVSNLERLCQETGEDTFEAEDVDEQSGLDALERLPLVSSILSSSNLNRKGLGVTINFSNTPEGISAAQVLLSSLGQRSMDTPEQKSSSDALTDGTITLKPIASGMALGLVGGVGIGMAIDALRETGNSTGNPVISGLAIGLGLAGTAFGGHLASGGSFKAKFFGVEISAES